MRIEDAKKAYSAQLNTLWEQKHTLKELLKDSENNTAHHFDRVEISRELSITEAQYEATKEVMDSITATEALIHNAETARQQSEAAAETANEFGKILTIYRRIAAGGEVPSQDERKLMEFSHELYMAAKAAAAMAQGEEEKYDSLWEDENHDKEEAKSASEVAADAQIAVPSPAQVAASCLQPQTNHLQ